MKRILIITAYHTGMGHKSISDAVSGCLSEAGGVECREVDGFTLLGPFNQWVAGTYGRVIGAAPWFYEFFWNASDRIGAWPVRHVAFFGFRRFRALLEEFRPDLVLTVHSLFNRAVSVMLERAGKQIPLAVVQADIRTLHSTWCNPRAELTFCPTEETYRESLRLGMPEDRLRLTGFPLRKQFTEAAALPRGDGYDGTRPVKCLMILGSEGSNRMEEDVKNLLDGTEIHLTVACGNNEQMRAGLARLQAGYPGRLEILGFTEEIARVMREHDLLIARSSPNILFEGIAMNLPVVAISALKAQEEGNDLLVASRNLGVRAADYPDLKSAVLALAEPGKYRSVQEAQRAFYTPDSAQRIAGCVLEMLRSVPR